MGALGDLPEHRVLGRQTERGPDGLGSGEQRAGEAVGERRLADALRTAEQPAVRQAAGAERAAEDVERRLLAQQIGIGARLRRRSLTPPGPQPRAGQVEAEAGLHRGAHLARDDRPPAGAGVDHDATLGRGLRDREEALADALVIGRGHLLEAVRAGARAAPREADRRRQIEDQGQIGREIAEAPSGAAGRPGRARPRRRCPDRPGSSR